MAVQRFTTEGQPISMAPGAAARFVISDASMGSVISAGADNSAQVQQIDVDEVQFCFSNLVVCN